MRSGARRGRGSRFPEGEGARAGRTGTRFSRRGKGGAVAGGPAGLCKRVQGTAARRVAAVPVCPPFRDRSRGGREVGIAPPAAGDCRERGCAVVDGGARQFRGVMREDGGGRRFRGGYARGRRGAAVPGSYARGRREPGELVRAFPGGGRAARSRGARRVYARGCRGRRPGGWLPCRFARHFVTGRGVAVKWGLRRRSPGVVVKRGCTAVDGGARQFRGGMR